jgi:hypothetical protein
MSFLVNRLVPSGSMPALVTAVSLTSDNTAAQQSSTMRDEEMVVSDTHICGGVTGASLITVDQNAPGGKGGNV